LELSTVLGLFLGILGVGLGMILKGASLSALVNPAAFLIIIVGTIACLFNAFPMDHVKKTTLIFKKLFTKQELMPKSELLSLFIELAQIARREGVLALESRVEEFSDPFMKTGLSMIIDGMDQEFVADVLEAEIHSMEERHRDCAAIFTQAGTYAPTLGVLGAVVGLIAALGNLNDIEKLGHSIAAAFVATLLGIFTGYVCWHPFANKLKMLSKQEAQLRQMMVEGILSLQAGNSPTALETKLMVFLSPSERAALPNKLGDNNG